MPDEVRRAVMAPLGERDRILAEHMINTAEHYGVDHYAITLSGRGYIIRDGQIDGAWIGEKP